APSITVTVLDAGTHTPVKGAHVTFGTTGATPQPDGGPSGTGTRDAAPTDEHGVARLSLDSERAARLMVRHPDYAASIGDEIGEAPAGEIARTVLLARGGRVVVEVLDA